MIVQAQRFAEPFFLIFFVEWCFVSVTADQDVRHPVRCAAHDGADAFHRGILAAFYDEFVMDMAYDEAEGQVLHGEAQEVPGNCLDDIFHEFWTVGFYALPFFVCSGSFVGDGFPAETVFPDAGLDVGEQASGWETDEEKSAFIEELDAADFCRCAGADHVFDCGIDIPPELYDVRVGCAPGIDQGLQFFFRQAHVKGTHGFQGTDGSAIA